MCPGEVLFNLIESGIGMVVLGLIQLITYDVLGANNMDFILPSIMLALGLVLLSAMHVTFLFTNRPVIIPACITLWFLVVGYFVNIIYYVTAAEANRAGDSLGHA